MQRQPDNFERARNVDVRPRWAGDPERWGVTVEQVGTVTTQGGRLQYGPTCLRAQTRDLIATTWDLFVTWTVEGIDQPNDEFDMYLEVTIGTGQSSSTVLFVLSSKAVGGLPSIQNTPALANGWEPLPIGLAAGMFKGVAVTSAPFPAVSINARPLMVIRHIVGIGVLDHPFKLTTTAHTSPRSWVP